MTDVDGPAISELSRLDGVSEVLIQNVSIQVDFLNIEIYFNFSRSEQKLIKVRK